MWKECLCCGWNEWEQLHEKIREEVANGEGWDGDE